MIISAAVTLPECMTEWSAIPSVAASFPELILFIMAANMPFRLPRMEFALSDSCRAFRRSAAFSFPDAI